MRRLDPFGRLWLSALAVLLWVNADSAVLGQTCEDRDLDGFFSEDGCGTEKDCNDDDAAIYPGAVELCDGRDGDCNGSVDDSLGCDRTCDNPEPLPGDTQVSPGPDGPSQWGNVVWVGDGWVVAYETRWGQDSCTEVFLQKLDPEGNLVGDPVSVSGGPGQLVRPHEPWVVWTGSELMIAWEETVTSDERCVNSAEAVTVFVQRFARDLQPLAGRLELGCFQFDGEEDPNPAWTGNRYGVAWEHRDGMRFTTISRDGVPTDACGMPITEGPPLFGSIVWSGSYFGVSLDNLPPAPDVHSEIYFRRVAEDMTLPDPEAIRETFDPARSQWNSIVWTDGEWAISWADERDTPDWGYPEIYLMRLGPDGTKIDPPGDIRITCCNMNQSGGGFPRRFNTLRWTGEEFGLAFHEDNHPIDLTGDIFFQRIDSDGNTIGNPVLVTIDPGQNAYHVHMDWNGTEYGVVWDDFRPGFDAIHVMFGRVGCNCTDTDGDNFSSCAGGDCNDDDPFVHPGQPESCLDGVDNNCDTLTDCQAELACPPGGGPVPGEVTGLVLDADKETLSWDAEPDSDVYDILTGEIGELRADGDFGRATCLAWRVPDTSYADARVPPVGVALYYLVRGKADPCKLGTWGSVQRDGARLTCP